MTVDHLMALRTIVDVRISPDGERVAYAVSTPSLPRNAHEVGLFVVPASGGSPAPVAVGVVPAAAPALRWSPDGQTLTFLAAVDGRQQVLGAAVTAPSDPARRLSNAAGSVTAYEWSPDGRRLAYVATSPPDPEAVRAQQDPAFVIHADPPDRPAGLFVESIGGDGGPRRLSAADQFVDSLSWIPGSEQIVYGASSRAGFLGPYSTRLFLVSTDGTRRRVVVDRPGMNARPVVSPDGARVAFISTSGRVEIMAPRSLTVASLRESTAPPRTFGLDDAWVNEFVWTPDSRAVYLQANDGTFGRREHMFEQAIVRVDVTDGSAKPVFANRTVNYALSLSARGDRLAFRSVQSRTMGDVVVLDVATSQAATITDVNPELRDLALGELTPVSWPSTDGFEVWGLLLTPPGYRPGARLPLLVYCHGGPGGGVTYGIFPQFMHTRGQVDPYPAEAMAGAGFAVLFPMPRGGAGYGEAGQRAIVNDWGGIDYRDIMTGVDALVTRGVADPGRLGVMGASYGGYMTNWIVTQTSRFKAASAGASLSDLTQMYYLSEGGQFLGEYFGAPSEHADAYASHSPITFAKNVTTPLLIQHGERDPRVPVEQAWLFYRALKSLGKTVELDIHPRGGHVLMEPVQERAAMQRNLEWFTKWVLRGSAGPVRRDD